MARGQPAVGEALIVYLEGELHKALYELAEDRGLVIPGSTGERDPVRVLVHEVLGAYTEAKGPTLAKIAERKLKKEIADDEAASERVLEGRRIGRMSLGLGPLPGDDGA